MGKPSNESRSLKELIDNNAMGDTWKNMIQKKVILDESHLDVTEYDPLSTYYEDESVPFVQTGIHRNSIPVFKTKSMEMTNSTLFESKVFEVPKIEKSSSKRKNEEKENVPKKSIGNLVTKVPQSKALLPANQTNAKPEIEKYLETHTSQSFEDDNKVPPNVMEIFLDNEEEMSAENEIHKLHMLQSLQALRYLK